MDILGILGILMGILTIILFITKKFNIIIAAPIATIVILLFNDVPILETVFGKENSYMTALAGFVASNFAIFFIRFYISEIHGSKCGDDFNFE